MESRFANEILCGQMSFYYESDSASTSQKRFDYSLNNQIFEDVQSVKYPSITVTDDIDSALWHVYQRYLRNAYWKYDRHFRYLFQSN